MDTRRLKYVNDVSPVYQPGSLPPYDATRWAAEAQMSLGEPVYHANGFTTTVFRNPLFTWTRSFSTNNNPVTSSFVSAGLITPPSRSLIFIDEWVPGFGNTIAKHGYTSFGAPRKHAIAEVPLDGLVETNWSTNARRHLKTFQKQTDVTIRLGTYNEIKEPYKKSSVPANMRSSMCHLVDRHLRSHPDTVEVLIAESKTHGIVAAFIAGNCVEASSSFYLLGFYLPAAREAQAMTGLIHAWFERTRKNNLQLCNFGDICGPNPLPLQSDRGYSIFKTHFGIRRVNYPGSHWKIRHSFGPRIFQP
jgi:hypothetical protein